MWRIYGVDLPDEVLKKIYHENAVRLIPGVRERVEKFVTAARHSSSAPPASTIQSDVLGQDERDQ